MLHVSHDMFIQRVFDNDKKLQLNVIDKIGHMHVTQLYPKHNCLW